MAPSSSYISLPFIFQKITSWPIQDYRCIQITYCFEVQKKTGMPVSTYPWLRGGSLTSMAKLRRCHGFLFRGGVEAWRLEPSTFFRREDVPFGKFYGCYTPMVYITGNGRWIIWRSIFLKNTHGNNFYCYCLRGKLLTPVGMATKHHMIYSYLCLHPRSLTVRPWKMMVGRQAFPFGIRPIFRGNILNFQGVLGWNLGGIIFFSFTFSG